MRLLVVDLRAASLLALCNMHDKGQPLLRVTLARLSPNAGFRVLLVATAADQQAVTELIAPIAATRSIGVVTEEQAARIIPSEFSEQSIVWLKSLVPELSEGELQRICSEHAKHSQNRSSRQASVIRGAVMCHGNEVTQRGGELTAGFIADASRVADLLDESRMMEGRDARGSFPLSRLDHVALADLSDWSALKLNERRQQAEALLHEGVWLEDWTTLDIGGELQCAPRVRIGPHVIIKGRVTLDQGVEIGAYTYLQDVHIGANTQIKAFSCLEDSKIAEDCRVGPYARLRGHTVVGKEVSIGNFVELKATNIGPGGRINHLSFLGDADLQQDVTIGAGVITCNHDGEKIVPTRIEQGAYVGCGSQLVAPIVLGEDATIGAGSTITEDVEPGGLTLARSRQVRLPHWVRKDKK